MASWQHLSGLVRWRRPPPTLLANRHGQEMAVQGALLKAKRLSGIPMPRKGCGDARVGVSSDQSCPLVLVPHPTSP